MKQEEILRQHQNHAQTKQQQPLHQNLPAAHPSSSAKIPRRRSSWPPKDPGAARKRLHNKMWRIEKKMQETRQKYQRAVAEMQNQRRAFREKMQAKYNQCKSKQEVNVLREHIKETEKRRSKQLKALTVAHKRNMQELQLELERTNRLYSTLLVDAFDAETQRSRALEADNVRKSSAARPSALSSAAAILKESEIGAKPRAGSGEVGRGGGGGEREQKERRGGGGAQAMAPAQTFGSVPQAVQHGVAQTHFGGRIQPNVATANQSRTQQTNQLLPGTSDTGNAILSNHGHIPRQGLGQGQGQAW